MNIMVRCECGNYVNVPPSLLARMPECECPCCRAPLKRGQPFQLVPMTAASFTPEDVELLRGMKIEVA
jgi:hypothetical protein